MFKKNLNNFIDYIVLDNYIVLFFTYVIVLIIITVLLFNIENKNLSLKLLYFSINNFFGYLFLISIIKVYLTLWKLNTLSIFYNELLNNHFIKINSTLLNINNGLFSDVILILSLFSGLMCFNLLNNKNLSKSLLNIIVIFFFFIAVIFMVYTNNLLILFISFECIFLPTIYIIYFMGYSKKSNKSCKYLIIWTLFGAFLVLNSLGYLFGIFNNLNFYFLRTNYLTRTQINFIYLIILFGFSVKIPLVPFQHWLLKVHVESPAAFSIFLSGFLVKAAIFCFYNVNTLLQGTHLKILVLVWILLSLLLSSVGLFFQTDFKKLIAWATVQEMSLILFFLIIKTNSINNNLYIFILLHGILSSYMFYIVEIIQKKFKTREIFLIQGLSLILPKSVKYLWFLIFIFTGFPLTAKFYIEWDFIITLLYSNYLLLLFLVFFINFIATISFCRIIFTLIYGKPLNTNIEVLDLQKTEIIVLNCLIYFIVLLTLCVYIL